MLSNRVRNTLVGLTMIAAMAVLMYGIILLGKMPAFGGLRPYTVTLESENANGISNASKVDLNGVIIGQVDTVTLVQDPTGKLIAHIGIAVDGQYNIPSNSIVSLGKAAIGTPYVSIYTTSEQAPPLSHDGKAILRANAADASLIPPLVLQNLTQTSDELRLVATDMHRLLVYNTPEAIAKADPKDPNHAVENVSTLIVRLNTTMDSVQRLLTDTKLQDQIRTLIQNLADSSAQLKQTLAKAQETLGSFTTTSTNLQKQTETVTQKLADTLEQLQKSVRLLAEGNGTTGKLINDPRLYNSLVDLSKELQTTVADLDFLMKKWKDEGVNLKLK